VDSWEGQHPAPLEAGYAFVDSLIKDIQNFLLSSTIECSNDDSTNHADEISKKILYLKILATSEFEGFTRKVGL
jgi:hypothetical protein